MQIHKSPLNSRLTPHTNIPEPIRNCFVGNKLVHLGSPYLYRNHQNNALMGSSSFLTHKVDLKEVVSLVHLADLLDSLLDSLREALLAVLSETVWVV